MKNNQTKTPEAAPAADFVPTHGGVYFVEAGKVTTIEGGKPPDAAAADAAAPVQPTEGGAA